MIADLTPFTPKAKRIDRWVGCSSGTIQQYRARDQPGLKQEQNGEGDKARTQQARRRGAAISNLEICRVLNVLVGDAVLTPMRRNYPQREPAGGGTASCRQILRASP
jgi:hypothetical protein